MVVLGMLRHDRGPNRLSLVLDRLKAEGRRLRGWSGGASRVAMAEAMRRADAARDERDPSRAAILYQNVLDRWGQSFGVLVQLGNALKDSGSYRSAELAYRAALEIQPLDADCHLQMGHLMKLAEKPAEALKFYRMSNQLDPALPGPRQELRLDTCDSFSPSTARPFRPVDAIADRSSRSMLIRERFVENLALRRG